MKILLALDGSEYGDKVVDYIVAHRDVFGAAPDVACVYVNPSLPPHVTRNLSREDAQTWAADEAKKATQKPLARLEQAGIRPHLVVRSGHAGEEIAKAAGEGGYDMLVMGSHGAGALRTIALGSTVTRVLGSCGVPVLVIR